MCGSSDNSGMIKQQKREAEIARKAEEARKKRLNDAMAKIKGAFHGTKATPETAKFDWDKFKVGKNNKATGLPTGYTYTQLPSTTKTVSTGGGGGGGQQSPSSSHWQGGGGGGGSSKKVTTPGAWVVKGPDGKTYKVDDPLVYNTGEMNPATAGFDKAFYDTYRNAMTGYYEPQVAEQYADANREATYRLARAGTLQSSAATDTQADLAKQNLLNVADVRSQSDSAVADLKTRIAQEEDNAILQAQSVEDPSIAANNALSKVANLNLQQPELSPLGEVFKVATIGAASGLGGYTTEQNRQKIDALRRGSNTVIKG